MAARSRRSSHTSRWPIVSLPRPPMRMHSWRPSNALSSPACPSTLAPKRCGSWSGTIGGACGRAFGWEAEMFDVPEELQEFRGLVREIVEEKIGLARAAEIDEADEFPWDVHKVFVENELMGVGYPEEYGGAGGGSLTFAVMVEEISRVAAGCPLIPR